MGEQRRREAAEQISKERFLAKNPRCLYCGRRSEEPDHVPPRAYFQNGRWAEGYWFPACVNCNRATSQSEQVVAAFARIAATSESRIDTYWRQLMQGSINSDHELALELASAANRNNQRRLLRQTLVRRATTRDVSDMEQSKLHRGSDGICCNSRIN